MYFYNLLQRALSFGNILRYVLIVGIPASLFFMASVLILKVSGFDLIEILRDPAQQSGKSSFLGFLSNIGNFMWISAAAIGYFALVNILATSSNREMEFLILAVLFSAMLGIDDFFLIHDRFINEKLCYAAYAAVMSALMVRHYKTIVEIDGLAFLLTGIFLALSILTDLIQEMVPIRYSHSQVIEEGFKFIGIASWLYFNFQAASYSIKHSFAGRA